MKEGFCLNSRIWLRFLFNPPKSCPLYEEKLLCCEKCGYYKLKELTNYAKRKRKLLDNLFKKYV